ncbi:hypothetical protein BH10ACT3_BH10ACT3_09160 [soil metagenome]
MGLPDLPEPNPLLTAWADAVDAPDEADRRERAIADFAFAVPDDKSLERVAEAPNGVVELGAGTGYWARLLSERGVDVLAFDVAPPPSPDNPWFASSIPWFDVRVGDQSVLDAHPHRTLLLVWPTRNEDWPGDAVERFAAAGGTHLLHVGEGPGGHTGDDRFHALVGSLDRCWSCAYGVTNTACVCGIVPRFERMESVTLPHWTDYEDDLHVHVAVQDAAPLGPTPARRQRRSRVPRLSRRDRR